MDLVWFLLGSVVGIVIWLVFLTVTKRDVND